MWRLVLPALAGLSLFGCAGDGGQDEGEASRPTAAGATLTPGAGTTPSPAAGEARVVLEEAFGGRQFDRPTELAPFPGGRFFVADQSGLVSLMGPDGSDAGVLLDLRGKVLRGGAEEGLLSVALDAVFPGRPYLYVYYSATNPRRTVLSRFEVAGDRADPASELVILEQAQPFSNHNGGAIRFGPDGMLYLGLGDGGTPGDSVGNAQNLGVLLGKVIRIDVRDASAEEPYAAPGDNPFAGQPGARAEVWAYGLRNPWRMSFDPADGRLWAGDVGASAVEEIDVIEAGGNYGWNRVEGDQCFSPRSGCDRSGLMEPVTTYSHDDGCSVTGGVVYRGAEVPALEGQYLYADYCSGRLWAVPSAGGEARELLGEASGRRVSSFAEDSAGEVYLLVHGGAVLRLRAEEASWAAEDAPQDGRR
ncbi:MAG: sorbosone dehydrogenase family protein [Dehalococcoidia bacterium]